MSGLVKVENSLVNWLESYEAAHPEYLSDPDFAAWLQTEYIPIAGGWQY